MKATQTTTKLKEGTPAFERFRNAVKAVLSVSKDDLPPRPNRKNKTSTKRKA